MPIINGTIINDILNGTTGDDTLDGLSGADRMTGLAGNDVYVVDNTGDVVVEASGAGTDLVLSGVVYTLSSNVEGLTLTGTGNINATGNTLNNILTGNSGNNLLNGSSGIDTLIGGLGDDTYVVDSATDILTEAADAGTDLVQSSVSFSLAAMANIENLTITGTSNRNATGNALDNVLTGNSGSNILNGGDGVDTLAGGTGNDTYVVDSTTDTISEAVAAGTDTVQSTVSFSLAAIDNVEKLTLTGTAHNSATGNTLANTLIGNTGNNLLDGGSGKDTMIGGTGNDTYVVDSSTDVVSEAASAGTDLIQSSATFTASGNVENLTLTGTGNINATGNTLNNILTGNSGNNLLNGSSGIDTLIGGLGNDTYGVDSVTDILTEAAEAGTDLVQASVSFSLAAIANIENLTLTGTGGYSATGNSLDNVLTGNSGANTLNGGDGVDTLAGGTGNDTYVVDSTTDTISEAAAAGTDTVQSTVSFSLAAIDNVEKLTLTGTGNNTATGNMLANTLTGNSGNNLLDGGAGTDTLVGGTGDDTYVVDSTTDVVTEGATAGTDLIQSSVTFTTSGNVERLTLTGSANINATGNTLNNVLTGNSGNNLLNGSSGIDTLVGGLGNDTYVVDSTTDILTEAADAGTDLVQSSVTFSLAAIANIENLTLTGTGNINATGNSLSNALVGTSGNNLLDGGAGVDSFSGGGGNDTYVVDDVADAITEAAASGTDLVRASSSYSLAAIANVENLTLTGTGHTTATGNTLNNTLTGNTGNNILNGGAGTDILIGGAGDDTYVVDSTTETLTEATGAGTDTVQSSVTFTLAALTNIENLMLTGAANINAIGNTGDNVLSGNAGINTLNGGNGNDTLNGGGGNDILTGGAGTDTAVYALNWSQYTVSSVTGVTTVTALTGAEGNDTLSGMETLVFNGVSVSIANALNDGPVGVSDSNGGDAVVEAHAHAAGDAVAVGNVLGNDTDADLLLGVDEQLTVSSVNGVSGNVGVTVTGIYGQLLLAQDGSYTYTLNNADADTEALVTGQTVLDVFNYGVVDAHGASGSAVLSINIDGRTDNRMPVLAEPDAINLTDTALNDSFAPVDGLLIASDAEGGSLVYGISGGVNLGAGLIQFAGMYGALTVNSLTGSYRFLADANAINALVSDATETYSVTVSDGEASVSRLLSIHIAQDGVTESLGNDVFSGTAGADHFEGLAGDDTYVIGASDTIVEAFNEGIDTVVTALDYTLGANLENLVLTGRALLAGGNGLDNGLTGNAGNNTLVGGAGNDRLDGGLGTDTLVGGTGDDTYVVDALDKITELAGEGVDTVEALVSWTLGNHLENLLLTGTAHVMATGNTLDNVITGNSGFNILNGGLGNDWLSGEAGNDTLNGDDGQDTLVGGQGNDILSGGLGSDTYQIQRGQGTDTITDVEASANTDVLWFNDATISSDQLWFRQTGADLEVAVIGTTTKALVKNWFGGAANQIEEIRAGDGKVLLNTEVQNLVSAMAAFSTRPAGSTSLTVPEQAALTAVLAANWS